jgi:hypothetical protein
MRAFFGVCMLAALVALCACRSEVQPASVDSIKAPLPTPPPAPSPTIDPAVTDLNRVKEGILAPDFNLEDKTGVFRKLSSYRGHKNVVLVFYRGYF